MKYITLIAASVLLFITGCKKVESYNPPIKGNTMLTAIATMGTKTSLDGLSVSWTKDDELLIYDVSDHIFTATENGNKVALSGPELVNTPGTIYYGFYPESRYTRFDASTKTFSGEIPITQHIDVNGQKNWDPTAPIMVGSGSADAEEKVVYFYNANALIEFKLPAAASSVTFNAKHKLAGPINATLGDGNSISLSPAPGAAVWITALSHLAGTTEGRFAANTPYYVASLPKVKDSDVSIIVRYSATNVPTTTPDSDLGPGDINQTGPWYYNLYIPPLTTKVNPMAFPQNEITRMDLNNAKGLHLEGPVSSVRSEGSYVCIGPDGNAIFAKEGSNSSWKYEQLHLTVYVTDTGEDDILLDGASGNQSGVPSGTQSLSVATASGLDEEGNTVTKIKFRIYRPYYKEPGATNPTTHDGYYWLGSSKFHPGCFTLVQNETDAALFEAFKFSDSVVDL